MIIRSCKCRGQVLNVEFLRCSYYLRRVLTEAKGSPTAAAGDKHAACKAAFFRNPGRVSRLDRHRRLTHAP